MTSINLGALTSEVREYISTPKDTLTQRKNSFPSLPPETGKEKDSSGSWTSRVYLSEYNNKALEILRFSDKYKGLSKTEIVNNIIDLFLIKERELIDEVKNKLIDSI